MPILLRYVPPIKKRYYTFVLIFFVILALVLQYFFTRYGILSILTYSLIYAVFMLTTFITLTKKYYLLLDEENQELQIHRVRKKKNINVSHITRVELYENKRSFVLTISTDEKTKSFSLSGSLSFEEPLFVPFLKRLEELNDHIFFGEYCSAILHGNASFMPWSPKMYFSYWIYILLLIGFYISTLVFLLVVKNL
jgi:hypothetical protein